MDIRNVATVQCYPPKILLSRVSVFGEPGGQIKFLFTKVNVNADFIGHR